MKTDEWNFKKQTALQSERATLASGKETRAPTPLVTREQKELSAERTQKPFPTGAVAATTKLQIRDETMRVGQRTRAGGLGSLVLVVHGQYHSGRQTAGPLMLLHIIPRPASLSPVSPMGRDRQQRTCK